MWLQWLVYGIPDAPKATERVAEEAAELLLESETQGDWEAAMQIIRLGQVKYSASAIAPMATIRKYDPVRADKLARNDWYRMRRYLEIALSLRDAEIAEGDGAVCRDVFALLNST